MQTNACHSKVCIIQIMKVHYNNNTQYQYNRSGKRHSNTVYTFKEINYIMCW